METLSPQELSRYNRHLILSEIGPEGQLKLKNASVLVIGAGGLGCPTLQYLTAAGVGKIGIVDFDRVDESNLQRQILFTINDIGLNKAEAAKSRLNQLNPHIHFNVYPFELNNSNAVEIFSKYDIIVDGSDNFSTRYLVNDACLISQKPLIYGSIFKFTGQVSVFNYKNGPSYRCLFPNAPEAGSVPSCSQIGVLGVLPGVIGSLQANETIKLILGLGDVLSGRLLTYDALKMSFNTLKFERQNDEIAKILSADFDIKTFDYPFFCGELLSQSTDETSILKVAINHPDYQIIDVRDEWEMPRIDAKNLIIAPLDDLDDYVPKFNPKKHLLVVCQSGGRSAAAIDFLKAHYHFNTLINLEGGLKNNPID